MTVLVKYLELKKQEAAIAKELDALKKEIRMAYGIGVTLVDGISVSRTMRTRIDLDKEKVLVRLGQAAFQECEKISESEFLIIKKV